LLIIRQKVLRCSVHDIDLIKDYAIWFKKWQKEFINLFLIMRVYFEKPRTTVGWKGFINDPDCNNTFLINKGLIKSRHILEWLTENDIPIATEFLETFTPQYLADLVTWSCIGARTCESPIHRSLASGLSMPTGIKNPTRGDLKLGIESIISTRYPHVFLGIDSKGKSSMISTKGNNNTMLVLRGDIHANNYNINSIKIVNNIRKQYNIKLWTIVDCSHDNSRKKPENQINVLLETLKQKEKYPDLYKDIGFIGFMIESHIHSGAQKWDQKPYKYGCSITDGCIDINETYILLHQCNNKKMLYLSKL